MKRAGGEWKASLAAPPRFILHPPSSFSAAMPFGFLREMRRREWRNEPFPDEWRSYLAANVGHYAYLSETEAARLHDDLRVFMAEKEWEGYGGLTLTDEIKVSVSAQACLLLLGFERHDYFPNVRSIVVYPASYHAAKTRDREGNLVTDYSQSRAGEAWGSDFPVVLSWEDTHEGGADAHDGYNLVLHEFAHKLDMVDGGADGVPRLRDAAQYETWAAVMSREFALLRREIEKGNETLLRDYGAQDEAEFFAVATEAFFEKSQQMRHERPSLYAVLKEYFGQDPASRVAAARRREEQHRR